jgi:thiol-disulfide isomerase/thioredoxin
MNNPRLNLRAIALFCAALGVSFLGGCGSEMTQDVTSQPKTAETAAVAKTETETEAEEWSFQLLDGNVLTPFQETGTKAIVLVFTATDCPVANTYQPTLASLQQQYASQGVQFIQVHPDREANDSKVVRHAREFQVKAPIVLDRELWLARRVNAEVTPEVFLIERGNLTPAYRGAIDNLYAGFGKKRPSADNHFLADAIESLLSNQPISVSRTKPIGCFISFDEL